MDAWSKNWYKFWCSQPIHVTYLMRYSLLLVDYKPKAGIILRTVCSFSVHLGNKIQRYNHAINVLRETVSHCKAWKKKELCLASDQMSKRGVVMRFGFCCNFFFWGGGVANILGQMEQHTAMHTKGVLDWLKSSWTNKPYRGGGAGGKKSLMRRVQTDAHWC